MLKKVFLIRHAQAAVNGGSDKDRPLTPDGERDSRYLGRWLLQREISFDSILCSTALRAKETANNLVLELNVGDSLVAFDEELYEAPVRILLKALNTIDEKVITIAMIAHNPSITYLAEYLTAAPIGNMDPGGVVEIDFDGLKWSELGQATGAFKSYHSPAQLNVG
ncbi:MAG: histidine phosphatase family protein [Cyclobacteriaceae bacterium]|nr:histidine phosphatase family protein [Cyclobacteriaceae bacterium HetDA_MAG_MS6]